MNVMVMAMLVVVVALLKSIRFRASFSEATWVSRTNGDFLFRDFVGVEMNVLKLWKFRLSETHTML